MQKHNLVDQDDGAGDGTSPPQQRSLTSTTNAGLERVTKLVDAAEGGWQALPAKTQIVVATGAAYVFSNLVGQPSCGPLDFLLGLHAPLLSEPLFRFFGMQPHAAPTGFQMGFG